MRKNELVDLSIESVTGEGMGLGRHEGQVVFVPYTCTGDRIKAKIVKVHKTYAYGIVHQILVPSSSRIPDNCRVYHTCGGCSLRHMTYQAELKAKAGWVARELHRAGVTPEQIEPIIPSPQVDGYRNKQIYAIRRVNGAVQIGFFAPRSHRVCEAAGCLLSPSFFGDIVEAVRTFLEEKNISIYEEEIHQGLVRHLFIRYAPGSGQVMVCLILNGDSIPYPDVLREKLLAAYPGIVSIQLGVNREKTNVVLGKTFLPLYGTDTIEDILMGRRFRLSPLSFYQVNSSGAALLYREARKLAALEAGDVLLDLYCGTGTAGMCIGNPLEPLIGAEILPASVEDARYNALRGGFIRARFMVADAGSAAGQLEREGIRPAVVVVDPPRKGCSIETLDSIVSMKPKRVVYISCNPSTLARDLAHLQDKGYRVTGAVLVDMFPRTSHVETVVLLQVKDSEKISNTMDVGPDDITEKVGYQ